MKPAILLGALLAACGTHGQLRVDSPVTPYIAPDISDITGIDEDDDSLGQPKFPEAGSAAAAPAPAPATPAAPAKPGK